MRCTEVPTRSPVSRAVTAGPIKPVVSVRRLTFLDLLVRDGALWREQALCHGSDPALWYPTRGDWASERAAKRVCAQCPCAKSAWTTPSQPLSASASGAARARRSAVASAGSVVIASVARHLTATTAVAVAVTDAGSSTPVGAVYDYHKTTSPVAA
jgi:hypothetical protein